MAANFSNSAWFYDSLSRLVYGKAIVNTQLYLLSYIKPHNKILIVGGGTGWILEELTRLHPSGLQITYVEVAAGMMALSQKRNIGNNQVTFINDAIENVTLVADFNAAITPFLFDNFTERTLKTVFDHIHSLLKPGSLWLNCDFQLTGKWWQTFLLKSMFLFFRLICGIEASKLPKITVCFHSKQYNIIGEKFFFSGFIVARVYGR
ncbi:class I SAM-dependent methyltransferase [Mucilaginibacter sp. FT3.2]|uniref:class I SAM-dependent methyltransferase n=1 Tax=Mucilaginibacter sp. FT3.2 TaxID=2723090 RepID=UPI00160BF483|nr:class I SAM-dependent methyltransferase [Mucilaginibacter sp. FT3.2]MBB6231096.1 ubiquinone/menaquinone biosynthesis C-methylase UbiE [Mucilaginibacter sp. FT3.2]